MEFTGLFRDETNNVTNRNILKTSRYNNTSSTISTSNKENAKLVIEDISMLSLSEKRINYHLPESSDLNNACYREQWLRDMKTRRWCNRLGVISELDNLERKLAKITFDSVTGERYIMETQDYRMELEMERQPLGRNFLRDTNVTPRNRKMIIDTLYLIVEKLESDRYTVSLAMALADRYVKEKGKKLPLSEYKNVVIACWFLSCKFELVFYPSIDDLCRIAHINDPHVLVNIETDVLKTVHFYVSIPIPIDFLRPLTLLKQREGVSHNIAKFFIDVSLYIYDLAGHPSHIVAAASYCLAMAISFHMISVEETWSGLMKMFTGLDIQDIKPTICILAQALLATDFVKELPALYQLHFLVIDTLNNRQFDIMRLSRP